MRVLATQSELQEAFSDFGKFTFDLIGRIDTEKNYLKFAAVNAQITLELFLKYYFVKLGRTSEIQKKKGNELLQEFVDFSQVLNHFYTSRNWSYGAKREFVKLIETRNAIVHSGLKAGWDRELAKYIIRTLFFIHATAWSDLGETLFFDNYVPHPIARNEFWKEGCESFVADLKGYFDCEVSTCLACMAHTVVSGEIMVLEDGQSAKDLICLNCLTSVNIEIEARLIECYKCAKNAYLLDALNEQDNQLYVGKCSECGADKWVRMCANCEEFYHPVAVAEVIQDGRYFCELVCAEAFAEEDENKGRFTVAAKLAT